jgi:hypothetical protein
MAKPYKNAENHPELFKLGTAIKKSENRKNFHKKNLQN